MLANVKKSGCALTLLAMLFFVGCAGTRSRADFFRDRDVSVSQASSAEVTPVDSTFLEPSPGDADNLPDSQEVVVLNGGLADEIHRLFAEAEQHYIFGVLANQDADWIEAQSQFEMATEILASLDLAEVEESDMAESFDLLLREISKDYQFTLASMGGLSSESSLAAFLLRFESIENLQDYQEPKVVIEEGGKELPVTYDIDIDFNDKVKNCIVYFQTVARKPMERYLSRSGRFIPLMRKIIAEYGLPADLVYLPMIESGFNPKAYSYAHASGPWQFISSTGRNYGLNRSWWRDERRDFVKSTHAASKYLKDLYEMFGDWRLALAAYNGGEGRVGRQIKRQKTRDFWKLRLKNQTCNYVPLFMAATIIAKDPERFGFADIDYQEPIEFDIVKTDKPLDLKTVAHELKVSLDELKLLNPELLRGVTPPSEETYELRVPKGYQPKFAAVYDRLPESSKAQWTRHRVRRGETISSIARKYGISQRTLVDANKLR